MHLDPTKIMPHSPGYFEFIKIKVLSIGGTPPYFSLKSTDLNLEILSTLSLLIFNNLTFV